METIQQLRRAHRNAVFQTTYKVEKFDDGSTKRHKIVERISNQSFKSFVEEAMGRDGVDYRAVVKTAHDLASKPRSEAKFVRTRAATQANREARRKRASGGTKKDTVVVAASPKR